MAVNINWEIIGCVKVGFHWEKSLLYWTFKPLKLLVALKYTKTAFYWTSSRDLRRRLCYVNYETLARTCSLFNKIKLQSSKTGRKTVTDSSFRFNGAISLVEREKKTFSVSFQERRAIRHSTWYVNFTWNVDMLRTFRQIRLIQTSFLILLSTQSKTQCLTLFNFVFAYIE